MRVIEISYSWLTEGTVYTQGRLEEARAVCSHISVLPGAFLHLHTRVPGGKQKKEQTRKLPTP